MALLMLSYASVQSIVMQVAMTSPATAERPPVADAMPGMTMPGMSLAHAGTSRSGHAAKPGHAKTAACPYCSAAGHLPILGAATPFRAPAVVSFAAFRTVASHGPRGPPSRQPRARDPPVDLPTL